MMHQEPAPQQRNYSVPLSPIGSGPGKENIPCLTLNHTARFDRKETDSAFPAGRGGHHSSAFNHGRGYAPPYGPRGNAFPMYNHSMGMNFNSIPPGPVFQGVGPHQGYQPQPIGTPLSASAASFNPVTQSNDPWNNAVGNSVLSLSARSANNAMQPASSAEQTYVSAMEPLNYRKLLDRSVSCNWKYIVDKIVCNNDQQASIFLQQKLKAGTSEQKYEIIECIIQQAYPLMVNRFGNFLIQRCFEVSIVHVDAKPDTHFSSTGLLNKLLQLPMPSAEIPCV